MRTFRSTRRLKRSRIYEDVRPEVERLLKGVVIGKGGTAVLAQNVRSPKNDTLIKVAAWNVEGGRQLDGIGEVFLRHPGLKDRDVLLLTELDDGIARSDGRFTPGELAEQLDMYYAFAPEYILLQKPVAGLKAKLPGGNTRSLHGVALLSRYRISNAHAIPLPSGRDTLGSREKRLGSPRALVGDIEHPSGTIRTVTAHLDARSSRKHRRLQMQLILDHLNELPPAPTVIGGDWNTTGFDVQSTMRAILGCCRRAYMPKRVARDYLPRPEAKFERELFLDLERGHFECQTINELGAGTLHYDVTNMQDDLGLREWVPFWCFPFIRRAAESVGGRISARVDWLTVRGLSAAAGTVPHTYSNLSDHRNVRLSDHDPITADLVISDGGH